MHCQNVFVVEEKLYFMQIINMFRPQRSILNIRILNLYSYKLLQRFNFVVHASRLNGDEISKILFMDPLILIKNIYAKRVFRQNSRTERRRKLYFYKPQD